MSAKAVGAYLLNFVLSIAVFLIVLSASDVYPFGSRSFLTEDLMYQYVDFFTWFQNVLRGHGSLFYAPNQALGSNTWGLYSYYLGSPLNLLIAVFPTGAITEFVIFVSAIKLGLAQVASVLFLRKRFGLSYITCTILALGYTWSGWCVTNIRNPEWLDVLIYLPLAALGVYRLIKQDKKFLLVLSVTLAIISCWYMAYMLIAFLIFYFALECAVNSEVSAKLVGQFVLSIALSLALSAFTFIPTVLAMFQKIPGSLLLQGVDYHKALFLEPTTCDFKELVKGFLPYKWKINDIPQLYSGVLLLLCTLGFVVCRKVSLRIKISALIMFLFLVLGVYVTPLYVAWCGFKEPNGFYCRNAFLVTFMLLWMASYFAAQHSYLVEKLSPRARHVILSVLFLAVVLDIGTNVRYDFKQMYQDYSQAQHNDYVNAARGEIASVKDNDPGQYRITKNITRMKWAALNEGMSGGYSEISSYSSAYNAAAVAFLNDIGYSRVGEFSTRYAYPQLLADSLLGVKYAYSTYPPLGFERIGDTPNNYGAVLYRNNDALALSYLVSKDAEAIDFSDTTNPFERQNKLINAFVGYELNPYVLLSSTENRASQSVIEYSVEVPKGILAYCYTQDVGSFQALISADSGVAPFVENHRFQDAIYGLAETANGPLTVQVSLEAIDLDGFRAETPILSDDARCIFYGLDIEKFHTTIDMLSKGSASVGNFVGNEISVTVDLQGNHEGQLLMVSTPNAKGWTASVNGKVVDTIDIAGGALMGVPVGVGRSDVKLTFVPPGLLTGLCITCITIVCLLLYELFVRRRRPKMGSDNIITSGNFTFTKTPIEGVVIVDVKQYQDDRGYFMETYKQSDFAAGGIDVDFVQDNQSASSKGVLRGLHFQIEHPQSKLVRVVNGKVFDVAVDLREGSPTYGQWEGVVLSAENHRQFFIPRGFAHGFLVLSDYAEFCYKCDDVYHPGDEGGLMWNDPAIGIVWPALEGDAEFDPSKVILSDKDKVHPPFARM